MAHICLKIFYDGDDELIYTVLFQEAHSHFTD